MAGTQFLYAPNRVIDANGVASGGSVYFYATGTSTPVTIYADEALTTPAANPVVVGADGLVPTTYMDPETVYRVRTVSSDGTVNSDIDPYRFGITEAELSSLEADKAAAAASATAASTSAAAAAVSQDAASTAKTNAETAEAAAEAAQAAAEGFRDEAEGFRDQTATNAGIYDDVTAAIAGTNTGDYFAIPSASATGYVDLYKNVDDTVPNASLIDTLPNETALTNAVTAAAVGQAAIGLPAPRIGLPGTRLDLSGSRFGGTYAAGTLASSSGGLATSVGTFTRATATYEQTGQGTFSSIASGTAAFGAKGSPLGLAIRPAATNDFGFSDKFDEVTYVKTNATVASSGTNCLGRTRYSLTDNATVGFHSIRQSEAVATGSHVTAIIVDVNDSTVTQMTFAHSVPFGSPLIQCDFATLSTEQVSGTDVDSHGAIDLGDGKVMFYMVATATSAATSACTIYMMDGGTITYSGTGKVLFIEHVALYEGTAVLPPILTTTSTSVTRNADTFTLATSGTQKTILVDIANPDNLIPSNGTAFDWNDGSSNNRVRVYNSGGNWTARATSGGVDGTAVSGPTVGLSDSIALAFDAGTVRWAVNGVAQAAVTGAPASGLTTLSLGHNASNSAQVNAYLAYVETANGALSNDELESITGATASSGGGTSAAFDTTEVVVQASSTRLRVFQHLNGGANDDWIGEDLEYRTFASQRSLGWARGKVARYTRIGEFTFTEVDEYVGAGSANDDSWKISGEAAGAFNAIMDETFTPSTAHGWREAIETSPDAFYADGVAITPATAGNFRCGSFRGVQTSILLVPSTATGVAYNTTGKFADGEHEWCWGGGISEYRNRIAYTATVTVDKDGYLAMYDVEKDFHDKAIYREGITTVATGTETTITTSHPFMRREGDDIAVDFEVIGGFPAAGEIFVQNSDASSAKGKIYFQPLAVDTVRNSGDVDESVVRHRWAAR